MNAMMAAIDQVAHVIAAAMCCSIRVAPLGVVTAAGNPPAQFQEQQR